MENSLETEYRRRGEYANETAYDNRLLINAVHVGEQNMHAV